MFLWVVLALVLAWVFVSTKRPSWLPNGPPLLPWVGNLLSFNRHRPHETFCEWADKYGSIYYARIGALETVVLTDPDLIQEAFSKAEAAARPETELFQHVTEARGIVSSSGPRWQVTRRFTLHHLRDLGMGKSKLEASIHTQIVSFIEQILLPNCGKQIQLGESLNLAIVNIIWQMVADEELSLKDTKGMTLNKMIFESLDYARDLIILDAFPWLGHVLPDSVLKRDESERRLQKQLKAELMPVIQKHRQEMNVNHEPKDYLEAMLQQQVKNPELYTDWHILITITDLFFAGNDTTSTTLTWIFCFLCEHPDVQRRVQEEIDAVVGRDRLPSLSDRPNMPYCDAVITESQRLGSIAPFGLPHMTTSPVTIGGYTVPAGVQVISNLHGVMRSGKFFADPLQFKPERFLDSDGKFKPNKRVMPFSTGRRQCLGEGMAKSELFLFMTGMLQSVSFHWPEGFHHDFAEDELSTLVRKPKKYELIPERR